MTFHRVQALPRPSAGWTAPRAVQAMPGAWPTRRSQAGGEK